MSANGNPSTDQLSDSAAPSRGRRRGMHPRAHGPLHGRGGRRLLAPAAGLVLAAALVTGCGGTADDPENTGDDAPGQEEPAPEEDDLPGLPGEGEEGADEGGEDPEPGDGEEGSDGGGEDPGDDPGEDENLFEGSWNFGHDEKELSAEELAALIEEEALARGPEEMHLTVECEQGIDTVAGETEADCLAIGDEGAEHPWAVTALPADAGVVIEIENTD